MAASEHGDRNPDDFWRAVQFVSEGRIEREGEEERGTERGGERGRERERKRERECIR